jgi:hypothetical protein
MTPDETASGRMTVIGEDSGWLPTTTIPHEVCEVCGASFMQGFHRYRATGPYECEVLGCRCRACHEPVADGEAGP